MSSSKAPLVHTPLNLPASHSLGSAGNNSIAIIALVVFFMAVNQSTALAQIKNTTEKCRKQLY